MPHIQVLVNDSATKLKKQRKKRSFQVLVAEGAPGFVHHSYFCYNPKGHVLAKELAARGLQTTLITDSAVFAMISRVNMVVVGVHAVMANGGVIAPVGLNMVALAARKLAVPFVVVAGTHKLCPLYPHKPEILLNDMRFPSELLDFGEFSDCLDFGIGTGNPLLHVTNPAFDYVLPELVNLFITDMPCGVSSVCSDLLKSASATVLRQAWSLLLPFLGNSARDHLTNHCWL